MKKKYFIIGGLILLGAIVFFTTKTDTKSAGWYLDNIVELRQQKQDYLTKVSEIDEKIIEYRKIMDKKQYEGLDYLGLTKEQGQPQRTGTETQELINQLIE